MSKTIKTPKTPKTRKGSRDHGDIASGVDFFEQLNYGGDPIHYPENDRVIDVPSADNDKYLSADIGTNSKLYAWQHYDHTGNHGEWDTDQPDLRSMDGISQFKVTANDTNGVWVKLTNNTGDDEVYTMYIHVSEDIGERTVSSEIETYSLVGIIRDNAIEHTTHVAVKDKNGIYVANGSCYFKNVGGDIILTKGPGFPENMSVTEDDDRFDFSLDLVIPSGPEK